MVVKQTTKKKSPARLKAIKQLIEMAGGDMKIAVTIGYSQMAVRGWVWRQAIPDEHWPTLAKMAGIDEMEIFRAHGG